MKRIVVAAALILSAAVARADGAATYAAKCKMCHGAQGEGKGAKLGPALKNTKLSDAELQKVIADGKAGTVMKPFKDKLSEAELEELVAYVKTLK